MSAFERILLHASVLAAALTGAVFFWMKYLLRSSDPFSVVHHPWQPHVLAIHVLVVPVFVFALGLIAREHVVGRFLDGSPRAGRRSGIGAGLLSLPLIASGYLMQVSTSPLLRWSLGTVHMAAGAAFALIYLAHLALSRSPRGTSGGSGGKTRPRRSRRAVRRRVDRSGDLGLESNEGPAAHGPRPGPDGRRP